MSAAAVVSFTWITARLYPKEKHELLNKMHVTASSSQHMIYKANSNTEHPPGTSLHILPKLASAQIPAVNEGGCMTTPAVKVVKPHKQHCDHSTAALSCNHYNTQHTTGSAALNNTDVGERATFELRCIAEQRSEHLSSTTPADQSAERQHPVHHVPHALPQYSLHPHIPQLH